MTDDSTHQGQRLFTAAVAAFGVLDDAGFQVLDPNIDSWRGASLSVASEAVTITVEADWWGHELAVWVRVAGAQDLPVEALLPELRGTLRLPRDATRGVLQRRLDRIVVALQTKVPEVINGGQPALDRVLRAGAEPA